MIDSKTSQLRAATKYKLEKVLSTGKPSGKMLLQDLLSNILKQPNMSLPDFIRQSEAKGIHLLFNRQSTSRIRGITYFLDDLKITWQKLGNRFKSAELIEQLNYQQTRDGQAISQANNRTREKHGDHLSTKHSQPPMNNPDEELAWFLRTLEQICRNTTELKTEMAVMKKDHWKEVSMLICFLVIPLTIAVIIGTSVLTATGFYTPNILSLRLCTVIG